MSGIVGTHKIAKVGDKWFVYSEKKGWVNHLGSPAEVKASKGTCFFEDIDDAKGNGFSPTQQQTLALAEKADPVVEVKK